MMNAVVFGYNITSGKTSFSPVATDPNEFKYLSIPFYFPVVITYLSNILRTFKLTKFLIMISNL